MPDSQAVSPQPATSPAPRTRSLSASIGLWLTLAGDVMAIIAFFTPWLDVFKDYDPTYPFPRRGYSPWMLLASGRLDPTVTVTGVFLLLILGMTAATLVAVAARTARRRSQAVSVACVLALLSLVLIITSVPEASFALSFNWPYLSSTIAYGFYLEAAGVVSVLIGLAIRAMSGAERAQAYER